jgi:NADH:ubiquinone oxidoreductase subunit D
VRDAYLAQPDSYVTRLNYCSGLINDFAYCEAVETLDGNRDYAAVPLPAHPPLRVSRIADHLTCVAASLMELGAMTAFLYLVMIRDHIYEHLASLTGARVTYTYGRIGGLARDLPNGWLKRLDEILEQYEIFVGRIHGLMDRNRIFIDRTRNVGVLSTVDAINWGFTGPILRSTGAPRDLRKDTPYLAYGELDFEVPVGINGDNYDRYYVRMREMDESVHMIRQLMDMLPDGPDQRRRPPLHASRQATRLYGNRVADQSLQSDHRWPARARRRRLRRARSTQRRARFLPRQHRRRHAAQGSCSLAELCPHGGLQRLLEAISSRTSSRLLAR